MQMERQIVGIVVFYESSGQIGQSRWKDSQARLRCSKELKIRSEERKENVTEDIGIRIQGEVIKISVF